MFAVPGFASLTPDLLKQQVDEPSSSQGSKSKKRKRGGGQNDSGEKVTSKNFETLWKTHIEGVPAEKSISKTVEKQKNNKPNLPSASAPVQEKQKTKKLSVPSTSAPAQDKGQAQNESELSETGIEPTKGDIHPSRAKLFDQGDDNGANKSKRSNKRRKKARPEQEADIATPDQSSLTAPKSVKGQSSSQSKTAAPLPTPAVGSNLTPLQAKMQQKLLSARFRHLNEQLYTTSSSASKTLFSSTPSFFNDYHTGFAAQVSSWPENPVTTYIDEIKRRGAIKPPRHNHNHKNQNPNPRPTALPRTHHTSTIADLGAGTAPLASALQPHLSKLKLQIRSFDLHAPNALVTAADIARLPLDSGTVDVAILCLALMGTNWLEFVEEAWRVLRWRGELWVAEIKSRFARVGQSSSKSGSGAVVNHSISSTRDAAAKTKARNKPKPNSKSKSNNSEHNEGDEDQTLAVAVDGAPPLSETTDVSPFIAALRRRGFALDDRGGNPDPPVDMGNKMFVRMRFVKVGEPVRGKCVRGEQTQAQDRAKGKKAKFLEEEGEVDEEEEARVLKPCVYKMR